MKEKQSLQKLAALMLLAKSQGTFTFVYDQQSSDESNPATDGNIIQDSQPTGWSFTPSLSSIGFVRLQFLDVNRNNGIGATVYVNLRSGSITGPIICSTGPVALPDNFGLPLSGGFAEFFFGTSISVQPRSRNFIQPVAKKL